MPRSTWQIVSVSELAAPKRNALVGGPFGSNLVSADYVEKGVPVIRGQNMGQGRWVEGEFVFVRPQKADDLSANLAIPGDLVFTQRGTLGQVALVPQGAYERYVVSQSQMKLSVNETVACPLFLYYFFSSQEQIRYIKANSIQTGVPHTNLGHLRATRLELPPLDEQRSISRVLGSLDDKIELNRRMNQTLEAMARAIFKSWFVDFDPIKYCPYSFSTTFESVGIGPVPKGWDIGRLDDLLVLQRGFDLPSIRRSAGRYPVMAASGPSGTHVEAMVKGPGVTTGRSGVLGNVYLVFEAFWPLNTSLWVKEFRRARPAYAYFLLQTLDLSMFNSGSAVPTLNRNHVHGLPLAVPPLQIIQKFEEVALPLLKLCHLRELESRNLATLRDTLLPKLLSGEIRVKQAEKMVGEVA